MHLPHACLLPYMTWSTLYAMLTPFVAHQPSRVSVTPVRMRRGTQEASVDWLSFIAELVNALAWPAAVLLIFAVLRAPLVRLIPLLERVKVKDFEFDFDRRLQEAAAEVDALPTATTTLLPTATGDTALLRLAQSSPRAAILEAWIRLEAAASAAARQRNVTIRSSLLRSPRELIQFLEGARVIDARQAAVFHDLRGLRNSAAHASNFTPSVEEAREYVRIAARLEQSLVDAPAPQPVRGRSDSGLHR